MCICVGLGPESVVRILAANLYGLLLCPGFHPFDLVLKPELPRKLLLRTREATSSLLQESSCVTAGRGWIGSEALRWQEETTFWEPCWGVGVTEVYSHCSWKGGGWQWEEGADNPE